jgi:hypothetical protein
VLHGMQRAHFVARVGHRAVDFTEARWLEQGRLTDHAARAQHRLEAYGERLRRLLAQIRAWEAEPICVTQQTRFYRRAGNRIQGVEHGGRFGDERINGVDVYQLLDLLNRKTLAICGEEGAIRVDLANELQLEDADFYDYAHTTPSGAAKIGHFLHAKLRGRFGTAVAD